MVSELRRAGLDPHWRLARTEAEFVRALEDPTDVVLCAQSLPGFGSLRALEILHERHDPPPLVVISETDGEDAAVEAIRLGATDYVRTDDANGPRPRSEGSKSSTAPSSNGSPPSCTCGGSARSRASSPRSIRARRWRTRSGSRPRSGCATQPSGSRRSTPATESRSSGFIQRQVEAGGSIDIEYRMVAKDGTVVWIHDRAAVVGRDDDGNATRIKACNSTSLPEGPPKKRAGGPSGNAGSS